MLTFSMTDVTIIMASRNGVDTLPKCLQSIDQIEEFGLAIEFLLVDSASTDETRELMEEFASDKPAKVLFVDTPGKSLALNLALDEAKGGLVVFFDDDVIVTPEIVRAYIDSFTANPSINVFAGQVRPYWVETPPTWLEDLTDEGLACGCTPIDCAAGPVPSYNLKGGNFAVRKEATAGVRFDTVNANWGNSSVPRGGEDTDFARRLSAADGSVQFVPNACVEHIIQPNEATLRSFFNRSVRIGRSEPKTSPSSLKRKVRPFLRASYYAAFAGGNFLVRNQTKSARWLRELAVQLGRMDSRE